MNRSRRPAQCQDDEARGVTFGEDQVWNSDRSEDHGPPIVGVPALVMVLLRSLFADLLPELLQPQELDELRAEEDRDEAMQAAIRISPRTMSCISARPVRLRPWRPTATLSPSGHGEGCRRARPDPRRAPRSPLPRDARPASCRVLDVGHRARQPPQAPTPVAAREHPLAMNSGPQGQLGHLAEHSDRPRSLRSWRGRPDGQERLASISGSRCSNRSRRQPRQARSPHREARKTSPAAPPLPATGPARRLRAAPMAASAFTRLCAWRKLNSKTA